MSNSETEKIPKKKPMPLWALLPLDALLIAGNLLTFAYFHHVNPVRKVQPDISAEYTSYTPPARSGTSAVEISATTAATVSDAQTTTAFSADVTTDTGTGAETGTGTAVTATTTAAVSADGVTGTTTVTAGVAVGSSFSSQASGSTAKTKITTTTTVTTAPPLQPDLSGWGAKFPDKFSYDATIVADDNSYKSHDLNITVTQMQVGSSVAYVADVYMRYYDNLMSDVINGDWSDRSQQAIADMTTLAEKDKAVLAVNGDFIAQRDTGMVVRGGQVRRAVVKSDVGCYYCDGTFRSIAKADFDMQTELSNYLYHTMTFGPILVQNGVAGTNIPTSVASANPRTGFGYFEPGHYAFVVVDGRQEGYSVGLTIDEFAAFMASLGCQEAYNLDGGASSVMYFNGKIINRQSGVRGVSDIFYFGEVQ